MLLIFFGSGDNFFRQPVRFQDVGEKLICRRSDSRSSDHRGLGPGEKRRKGVLHRSDLKSGGLGSKIEGREEGLAEKKNKKEREKVYVIDPI